MNNQPVVPEEKSKTEKSTASDNKHKLWLIGSAKVVPFIGFGNLSGADVSGMVVEENGILKPEPGHTKWHNIKAMMKRYLSNELENIKVKVTYDNVNQIVTTDKHGIYRCHFQHPAYLVQEELWKKVSVSIAEPKNSHQQTEEAEGEVMMISKAPQFGIISDIDDTILVSYATNRLMKLRLMLLNNAHTRMPFEGVAAFYQALQRGTSDNGYNPIFYVSNSEWNLYDLLYEFIDYHRIPKGPFFLRELSLRIDRPGRMRELKLNHKIGTIRKLFSVYDNTKFILIGDSGQKDPYIYSTIVNEFPGRVLAIYIRDIGIAGNIPKIRIISEQIREKYQTEMVLVKDTEAAALHAIEKGYIPGNSLEYIRDEKQKDIEKKNKPAEKLI